MNGKILDQINKLKKIARFGKTIWRESPSAAVRILEQEKNGFIFIGGSATRIQDDNYYIILAR